jgi:hypothetical protein
MWNLRTYRAEFDVFGECGRLRDHLPALVRTPATVLVVGPATCRSGPLNGY